MVKGNIFVATQRVLVYMKKALLTSRILDGTVILKKYLLTKGRRELIFHFFLDKKTKQKNQWNSKANAKAPWDFLTFHAIFLFQRNAIPLENSFSLWNPKRHDHSFLYSKRCTYRKATFKLRLIVVKKFTSDANELWISLIRAILDTIHLEPMYLTIEQEMEPSAIQSD